MLWFLYADIWTFSHDPSSRETLQPLALVSVFISWDGAAWVCWSRIRSNGPEKTFDEAFQAHVTARKGPQSHGN